MTDAVIEKLRKHLNIWTSSGFVAYAVIDGAKISNITNLLIKRGMVFGSLFRDSGDTEIMHTGPFLAQVTHEKIIDLLTIPDILQSAVFWSAPGCTGKRFWKHLRTLTLVQIPDECSVGNGKTISYRRAIFRHQDPETLSRTLPAMTPAQRASIRPGACASDRASRGCARSKAA